MAPKGRSGSQGDRKLVDIVPAFAAIGGFLQQLSAQVDSVVETNKRLAERVDQIVQQLNWSPQSTASPSEPESAGSGVRLSVPAKNAACRDSNTVMNDASVATNPLQSSDGGVTIPVTPSEAVPKLPPPPDVVDDRGPIPSLGNKSEQREAAAGEDEIAGPEGLGTTSEGDIDPDETQDEAPRTPAKKRQRFKTSRRASAPASRTSSLRGRGRGRGRGGLA